jgi:hypothetical protein
MAERPTCEEIEQGWKWYFSRDEEFWYDGGTTREATIAAGRESFAGDAFMICEARHHDFPFHYLFELDRIDEAVIDRGDDMWGEDQTSIFKGKVTGEQEKAIEAALIEAFKKAVAEQGLELETPWYFAEQRNEEKIPELSEEEWNAMRLKEGGNG